MAVAQVVAVAASEEGPEERYEGATAERMADIEEPTVYRAG
jgi:hypothetical protein